MCHVAHFLLLPPKIYRWTFPNRNKKLSICFEFVCYFTWCNKLQVNWQNDFHSHVFLRCNHVLALTSSVESADHLSHLRGMGIKIWSSLWPSFLALGIPIPLSTKVITGAKPQRVWFTPVFLHWGTAITAEINIAIPLYKQSLTRMNFCPWKQNGHGFTHLVCSPPNFTHVSNCSWQGHNRIYASGLEKLLCFSCRALCLLPPPISTGSCLVCHRSCHITVAHQGNDNNSSAWVWVSSFSLPVALWHDDVTLPCLKAVVKRAGWAKLWLHEM